jgi:hypothetical protein
MSITFFYSACSSIVTLLPGSFEQIFAADGNHFTYLLFSPIGNYPHHRTFCRRVNLSSQVGGIEIIGEGIIE